jgi:hypothetical protein
MIAWLRRVVTGLLWDESAAQRYLAGACYLIGDWLGSGGVIPGTEVAIGHVGAWYAAGPYLKAIGIYLGASGGLPRVISR